MPLVYFPKIPFSNVGAMLLNLVSWLLDDETSAAVASTAWLTGNGGSGGAGWTLVECYSANSGAIREIPVTGTGDGTLDSLPTAANGWRSGTLKVGDWCVLRCLGSNPYELYIEYEDDGSTPGPNSTMITKFMPLASLGGSDAFATGGPVTSPPAFPTTSVPVSTPSFFSRTLAPSGSTVDYCANADDQTWAMIDDIGTMDAGFQYIGALDGQNLTADPFPYVGYADTSKCYFDRDVFSWRRLSPVDRTTYLSTLELLEWSNNPNNAGGGVPAGLDLSLGTGSHPLYPLGVIDLSASQQHFCGWLRNVGGISQKAGAIGAVNDPSDSSGAYNFIYRHNNGVITDWGIVLAWDGTTVVP
jgi:hypothetical protein